MWLKFLGFSFPGVRRRIFCCLLFHMKEEEDKVILEITLDYSNFLKTTPNALTSPYKRTMI